MVSDPYKALDLPHTASGSSIKKRYRDLAKQCHPDRLSQQQNTLSEEEKMAATSQFAAISSAYALLSDVSRKTRYDHIYKFGGYDDVEDDRSGKSSHGQSSSSSSYQHRQQAPPGASLPEQSESASFPSSRKRKSMGIGYACTDPLAFVWTQGRVQATKTIAGIQIPTRLQMAQPSSGLRFAYSSGQIFYGPSGMRKYMSQTTQFASGKKFKQTESSTVHPDGRNEILIEGDDSVERRYSTVAAPVRMDTDENVSAEQQEAWYMHAWYELKDKLSMCYNLCNAVAV
jgi:curved DNA-binding protein CbpA